MIFNGNPSNIILSRRTSLVVPATGVTIATSFPASAFNKLDLPEFGLPAKTRVRPSLSKELVALFDKTEDRSFVSLSNGLIRKRLLKNQSLLRENQSLPLRRFLFESYPQRDVVIRAENSPCIDRTADRAASIDVASIKSATASAGSNPFCH